MPKLEVALDARRGQQGARAFERDIERLAEATIRLDRAVTNSEAKIRRAGTTASQAGRLMRRAFAFISAGLIGRRIVSTITQFQQAMAELNAVTNTVGSSMDLASRRMIAFEDRARQLGATTRFTAAEAAQGMVFLARAGFNTTEILDAIGPSLNLAAAANLELAEAADIASNVLSQFNLQAEETERVTDILTTTAASANTDVRQLAQALKFAGPVAGALGITLEETAAAIGVLGDSGIQASLAGTNLRGSLAALLAPTSAAQEALDDLRITFDEINPATNTLSDIFATFRDRGLKAADAVEIFGRRNAAAALIYTRSIDKLDRLTKLNEQLRGITKAQADILNNTVIGAWKELQSAIDEVILKGGSLGLTGFIERSIRGFTSFVRIVGDAFSDIVIRGEEFAASLLIIWEGIKTGFIGLWESMKLAATIAKEFITSQFEDIVPAVLNSVSRGLNKLGEFIQSIANSEIGKQVLGGQGSFAVRLLGQDVSKRSEAFRLVDEPVPFTDKAKRVFEEYTKTLTNLGQKFFEEEQNIIQGLVNRLDELREEEAERKEAAEEVKRLQEELNRLKKDSLADQGKILDVEREIRKATEGRATEEERIVTALREQQDTFSNAIFTFFQNYAAQVSTATAIIETSLGGAMFALEDFAVALTTRATTAAQAWKRLADSIVADTTRILTRIGLSALGQGIGSFFAPSTTSIPVGNTGNVFGVTPSGSTNFFNAPAPPSIFNPPSGAFGASFDVNGPQNGFPLTMLAHGQENVTITPKKNPLVNVTIINNAGVDVEQQEKTTGDGTREVMLTLTKKIAANIRGGGEIQKAMRETFGVNPRTARRI